MTLLPFLGSTTTTLLIFIPIIITYYRTIIAYVLTVILRIGIWSGAFLVVRKKRRQIHDGNSQQGHDIEFRLKTKITQLFIVGKNNENSNLLTLHWSSNCPASQVCDTKESNQVEEECKKLRPEEITCVVSSVQLVCCQISSVELGFFKRIRESPATGSNDAEKVGRRKVCLLMATSKGIHIRARIDVQLLEKKNDETAGNKFLPRFLSTTKTESKAFALANMDASFQVQKLTLFLMTPGALLIFWDTVRLMYTWLKKKISLKMDEDIDVVDTPRRNAGHLDGAKNELDEIKNKFQLSLLSKILPGLDLHGMDLKVSTVLMIHNEINVRGNVIEERKQQCGVHLDKISLRTSKVSSTADNSVVNDTMKKSSILISLNNLRLSHQAQGSEHLSKTIKSLAHTKLESKQTDINTSLVEIKSLLFLIDLYSRQNLSPHICSIQICDHFGSTDNNSTEPSAAMVRIITGTNQLHFLLDTFRSCILPITIQMKQVQPDKNKRNQMIAAASNRQSLVKKKTKRVQSLTLEKCFINLKMVTKLEDNFIDANISKSKHKSVDNENNPLLSMEFISTLNFHYFKKLDTSTGEHVVNASGNSRDKSGEISDFRGDEIQVIISDTHLRQKYQCSKKEDKLVDDDLLFIDAIRIRYAIHDIQTKGEDIEGADQTLHGSMDPNKCAQNVTTSEKDPYNSSLVPLPVKAFVDVNFGCIRMNVSSKNIQNFFTLCKSLHRSISIISEMKGTSLRDSTSKKGKDGASQPKIPLIRISIWFRTIDFCVAFFVPGSSSNFPVDGPYEITSDSAVYCAKLNDASVVITPPNPSPSYTVPGKESNTKMVVIKIPQVDISMTFSPHRSLPLCAHLVEEEAIFLCKGGNLQDFKRQIILDAHSRLVKFGSSVSSLQLSIIFPHNETKENKVLGPNVDAAVESFILTEFVNFSTNDDNADQNFIIMKSNGPICLSLNSILVHPQDSALKALPTILQSLKLETLGSSIHVTWSPVFQWFVHASLKKTEVIIDCCRKVFLPLEKGKTPKIVKKRSLTNIDIQTNSTVLNARAYLGGGSIIDFSTSKMDIHVTHDVNGTWKKPNVSFRIGQSTVDFNQSGFDVIKLDAFQFLNTIRRASEDEINLYCKKKERTGDYTDDVVTGSDGTPLLETVILNFGTMIIILPPMLDLGKVIDDASMTPRAMNEGLIASGLSKKRIRQKVKYQLMDIKVTISFLDATFMEDPVKDYMTQENYQTKGRQIPISRFGMNRKHEGLLERWSINMKELIIDIKRNTPPSRTQHNLNLLDEDKTRTHRYGPVIQGGDLSVKIEHLISILHPLTIATPLAVLRNFNLNGLFLLAGICPDTEGLNAGRQVRVPVKCHHPTCKNIREVLIPKCKYGAEFFSPGIPIKVFLDVSLSIQNVDSTYGMALGASIPRLLDIIQRLIPKPPVPPPESSLSKNPPPLSWWDNLRFNIHGKVSFSISNLSFRWLLDNVSRHNMSILLTGSNFKLIHSVGVAELSLADVIMSMPGSSYHMLDVEDRQKKIKLSHQLTDFDMINNNVGRHSLILVPNLKLILGFEWDVSHLETADSNDHHSPYMASFSENKGLNLPASVDKFEKFRSHGIFLTLNINLKESSEFATWIALRVDVLPWLTHSREEASTRAPDPTTSSGESPLPEIRGIEISTVVSDLKVGAWFDEMDNVSNFEEDTVSNGVCLTIPKVEFTLDRSRRKKINLDGPIKASMVDIVNDSFIQKHTSPRGREMGDHIESCDHLSSAFGSSFEFGMGISRHQIIKNHQVMSHVLTSTNLDRCNKNSIHSFECLQLWSQQTNSLDHLLIVDKINILDRALDDILRADISSDSNEKSVDKGDVQSYKSTELPTTFLSDSEMGSEGKSTEQEVPWTVLVAGMKLLWTLEIRDSVMSIVQDLLFAINFMKVNSRGTHQLMGGNEDIKDKSASTGEFAAVEALPNEKSKSLEIETNEFDNDSMCDDEVEIISSTVGNKVHIVPIHYERQDNSASQRPKSHLDYLLAGESGVEETDSSPHTRRPASPEGYDRVTETARLTTMSFDLANDSHASEDCENSYKKTNAILPCASSTSFESILEIDTVPTFDVHLSNPQIQLYSESTGGSVILAMNFAVVKGKKFVNLFTKNIDISDLTAENLLSRTEFQYTLDKMEIYSLSNNVEVDAGLQWLNTKGKEAPRPLLFRQHSSKGLSNDVSVSDDSDDSKLKDEISFIQQLKRSTPRFLSGLQQHEVRDFIVPDLFKKIMDRCTFKTRQEFHTPPLHLTKEELAEIIGQGLVMPLIQIEDDDGAIDHIEMVIDELSFLLDSYQFTTTLDLIRNVLLEPPKPPRQRFYQSTMSEGDDDKDNVQSSIEESKSNGKSPFIKNMEEAVFQWADASRGSKHLAGKRGREHLRSLAQELLAHLEEQNRVTEEPNVRRIKYSLSKAKWKIKSQEFVDDVEINFTGFNGIHNFSADGGVHSHISLEDLYVSSQKPGPDAIDFFDPTTILKTVVGVERSPCQRCGLTFVRTMNESNSCVFHAGSFIAQRGQKLRQWTCCKALWEGAPGCVSAPHTGMERAVALTLDALPRTVEGLTMYRHVEVNIFPGIPHTLVLQFTKSLTNLFSDYFLDSSADGDASEKGKEVSPLKEKQFQPTSEAPSDRTEAPDAQGAGDGNSTSPSLLLATVPSTAASYDSDTDVVTSEKKTLLFGKAYPVSETEGTAQSKLVSTGTTKVTEDEILREEESTNTKKGELIFVKYWRVGDINLNVSIAGFGKMANVSNISLAVPAFQRAYKIGVSKFLIMKFVSHLVKSIASCGLEIIRGKLGGKPQNKIITDSYHEPLVESVSKDSEREDADDDNADSIHADLLFGSSVGKGKKKKKKMKVWSTKRKEK